MKRDAKFSLIPLFFVLLNLGFLISCTSISLTDAGRAVTIAEDAPPGCEHIETIDESSHALGKRAGIEAAKNAAINRAAEVGADLVVISNAKARNLLKGGAEISVNAYKCPESMHQCEQGFSGKACHDYGLLLSRRGLVFDSITNFLKGCNVRDNASCEVVASYLSDLINSCSKGKVGACELGLKFSKGVNYVEVRRHIFDSMFQVCSKGNLEYCQHGYSAVVEDGNPSSNSKRFLVAACSQGHAISCEDLKMQTMARQCGTGRANGCFDLGVLASKRGWRAFSLQAHQKACELGHEKSCAIYRAVAGVEEQREMNRALDRQNAAIEQQTAQQARDAWLARKAAARSHSCNSSPSYNLSGQLQSIHTTCD